MTEKKTLCPLRYLTDIFGDKASAGGHHEHDVSALTTGA